MSQINRVPQGLQDLLASKNFGDNPNELGGIVAPTLDLFPFFAAERLHFAASGSVAISATGSFVTHVIPAGELWLIDSVSVRINTSGGPAAGDGVDLGVGLSKVINSDTPTIGSTHPAWRLGRFEVANVATAADVYSFDLPRLVPLTSNVNIIFLASNLILTAGSMPAVGVVRYYRLEV